MKRSHHINNSLQSWPDVPPHWEVSGEDIGPSPPCEKPVSPWSGAAAHPALTLTVTICHVNHEMICSWEVLALGGGPRQTDR